MGTYEHARMQTKEKIIHSFWKLYQKKNIDRITVKNITDDCGIHRGTFYLHFNDIYDVLEQIQKGLLDELRELCTETRAQNHDINEATRRFYLCYQKRRKYLHLLLIERQIPEFHRAYRQLLIDQVYQVNGITPDLLNEKEQKVLMVSVCSIVEIFIICADEEHFTLDDTINILKGFADQGVNNILTNIYNIRMRLSMAEE